MSLAEFFGQPAMLATVGIGVVGAVAIGYNQLRKGGGDLGINIGGSSTKDGLKRVIDVFRPTDHSGYTMPIVAEMEKGLQGPKKNEVYYRWFKAGPGFNFPRQRKFIGIEANAFTAVLLNDKPVSLKLPQALRILWGDAAYDKMPTNLKEILEHHQFGVTLYPEIIPESDKMIKLGAEDIGREYIKTSMAELKKNIDKKKKMDLWQIAPWIGVGCLIGIVLCLMHWIPIAK